MIIVLHPRSDRHRSQKSRQAKPCQLNSAKGRRGLSKCGLPRAGGALPTDDYCFAPPLGQAQVPKTQAGEALPTQSCEGQAEPCQMRVAKGRRSLANCPSKPRAAKASSTMAARHQAARRRRAYRFQVRYVLKNRRRLPMALEPLAMAMARSSQG